MEEWWKLLSSTLPLSATGTCQPGYINVITLQTMSLPTKNHMLYSEACILSHGGCFCCLLCAEMYIELLTKNAKVQCYYHYASCVGMYTEWGTMWIFNGDGFLIYSVNSKKARFPLILSGERAFLRVTRLYICSTNLQYERVRCI